MVTLDGGGTVTLSDSAQNAIVSDPAAATLNNYDLIQGVGTIGDANLTVDNFGTIDADVNGGTLVLDTS